MSPRKATPKVPEPENEFDISTLLTEESNGNGSDASEMYEDFASPTDSADVKPDVSSKIADEETPPKRIRSVGTRHTTEGFFTLVYGGVGTALVHTGTDIPVGRVLQFQAPVAGSRIDEIIAGSWLDKMLQPIVRYQDKAEGAASLLLLPLLVGAYERAPQLAGFPMFEQILRKTVETSLLDMAPILKKQAADKKRAARTVSDLSGLGAELGLDGEAMQDPVGAIIGGFFYTPEEPIATEESE